MSLITQADIDILNKQDDDTLAKWNCLMNSWKWPEDLADEPDDENQPKSDWGKPSRRSEMMQFIEKRVGGRAISWAWNKERMTIEEFKDFYDGAYCGDKEAKKRSDSRLRKKHGITA